MPASNIPSVFLDNDGSVTIQVKFTDMDAHKVDLLHVWLAGTGVPKGYGAGLAIDGKQEGHETVESDSTTFTLTGVFGANGAGFGEGSATVSAIAVLSPTKANVPAEVHQWGRMLTLVTGESR
jgi:hypothetical protein